MGLDTGTGKKSQVDSMLYPWLLRNHPWRSRVKMDLEMDMSLDNSRVQDYTKMKKQKMVLNYLIFHSLIIIYGMVNLINKPSLY